MFYLYFNRHIIYEIRHTDVLTSLKSQYINLNVIIVPVYFLFFHSSIIAQNIERHIMSPL